MKLFLAPKYKAQNCREGDFVRISSFYNRCQGRNIGDAILTGSFILGLDHAPAPKNGKPVCYNVPVGGNSAAALFDIAGE